MTPSAGRADESATPSNARAAEAGEDVGVYVHIPFCERVCPYCDFAVVATPRLAAQRDERYTDALLAELSLRQPTFAGRALASLYFGGGTPSLLRPESIARVVEAVSNAFPPRGAVEVTLEVNPSTLERERLPAFRSAGVGRVSVGVQSFDDGVLKRLGRAHRAVEAHRTLEACRATGFDSLSMDLIYAAPGQSLEGLARDLDAAIAFGPEHLSAYELSIEPDTPFATAAARGQLDLPDEDTAVALAELVEARLAEAGLSRYEISSYARPGFEAVHNRRYWRRKPVLGLGSGAVSNDPLAPPKRPFGARVANLRGSDAYLECIEAGSTAEAGPAEVFDAATARGEAIFLGLRERRGVEAAAFEAEFGATPQVFYGATLDTLAEQGLLTRSVHGDLALTARGRLLSDTVFAYFV